MSRASGGYSASTVGRPPRRNDDVRSDDKFPESEKYGVWISARRPWVTGRPSREVALTYRYALICQYLTVVRAYLKVGEFLPPPPFAVLQRDQ